MAKNFTPQEINAHYATRHQLRSGIYGEKPYANYGYWLGDESTIDEACDAMSELVAQTVEVQAGDRVLECGCGYGATASYIASRYQPGEYIGLDATEVRVNEARKLVAENGLSDVIQVLEGDATNLAFEDDSFDCVLAIECAFHFNTRESFLKEAFRVLKPGGTLGMSDIIVASTISLIDHTLDQLREYLGADLKCISDDNIYNAETYVSILNQIGFEPAEIRSIKDQTILQFAEHLDRVASQSPPDMQVRRQGVADHFRQKFMHGGDYVIVKAVKPN